MATKKVKAEVAPLDAAAAHIKQTAEQEAAAAKAVADLVTTKEEAEAKAKADEEAAKVALAKSDRETRWKAHLAEDERLHPEGFAARKATGEFDKIPDYFQ